MSQCPDLARVMAFSATVSSDGAPVLELIVQTARHLANPAPICLYLAQRESRSSRPWVDISPSHRIKLPLTQQYVLRILNQQVDFCSGYIQTQYDCIIIITKNTLQKYRSQITVEYEWMNHERYVHTLSMEIKEARFYLDIIKNQRSIELCTNISRYKSFHKMSFE